MFINQRYWSLLAPPERYRKPGTTWSTLLCVPRFEHASRETWHRRVGSDQKMAGLIGCLSAPNPLDLWNSLGSHLKSAGLKLCFIKGLTSCFLIAALVGILSGHMRLAVVFASCFILHASTPQMILNENQICPSPPCRGGSGIFRMPEGCDPSGYPVIVFGTDSC